MAMGQDELDTLVGGVVAGDHRAGRPVGLGGGKDGRVNHGPGRARLRGLTGGLAVVERRGDYRLLRGRCHASRLR